jgi:ABC-type branched-subunit amino acid transport system ATPase component
MTAPLLEVDLALPDGRLRLDAGEARRLPDDPRHVAALLAPAAGVRHVVLAGRELRRRSAAARVRAGLVAVGEAPVAPELAVLDHLGAVVGLREARRVLETTPYLAGRGDDPGGVLSGGERRLLAWALARALRPRVVVLDRAGTGLDDVALDVAARQVVAWRRAGVGVLVRVGRVEEEAWLGPPPDRDPTASAIPEP